MKVLRCVSLCGSAACMLQECIEYQSGYILTFNSITWSSTLYTHTLQALWEQLSMPFSDEEVAVFEPSRPMPIGGGCTVEPVGRWDLKGQKYIAWNVPVTQNAPASCCLHAIRFREFGNTL